MYFEMAAFITSVICWPKIRFGKFRWFILFLLMIVIVEFTGWYIMDYHHGITNGFIFNFSIPIEYIFYASLFAASYRLRFFRVLARVFIAAYIVFCILIFLMNGVYWFNSSFLLIGNISAIVFCCLFFYELLVDESRRHLLREPMFWIATGVLLFNVGEFLYDAFYRLLRQNGWDKGTKLFEAINNNLVLVLYLCIIIGLLCARTSRDSRETFVP